jgi:hypothetical protein
MHCNAHPNNLILLPPQTEKETSTYIPLLAPLDFDMAFTEKSVTSLAYVDSFRFGRRVEMRAGTNTSIRQLLDTEVRSMRLALAGDSELNTGTRYNSKKK